MIGRSALKRGAKLALRRQDGSKLAQQRTYAAASGASTETASFESTEINGIKVASRDPRSPTARLAIVAKAGTRYQPLPGLTVGLESYAFKASHIIASTIGLRTWRLRGREDSELICCWCYRPLISDPPCASRGSLSFWEAN